MDHLDKYFNNKNDQEIGEFISDIVSLTVSEKIDGTPLQMVTEGSPEKVSFHSKSSDMKKPGPLLTSIDLFMNPAFWDQVEMLKSQASNYANKMFLKYLKVLNFEIVVENKHHIVQYDNKPEGSMFLLNAVTTEGGFVKQELLESIGKALGVEAIFSSQVKSAALRDLIEFSRKNPKSYSDDGFKAGLSKIVGNKITSLHRDIEGIVIRINGGKHDGLMLKIDSKMFKETMEDRKNTKLTSGQEAGISEILKSAKMNIEKDKLNKWSNDPLENMIINYEKSLACDKNRLTSFIEKCKSSEMAMNKANPSAIPEKYKGKAGDPDWILGLENFIWLFRKHRKGVLKDANEYVDIIASGA